MRLTDLTVRALTRPGRFTDGQTKGLHLWVKAPEHRYWQFRYTFEGRRKTLSLGPYPEITLKFARERATEARESLNRGIDPLQARKAAKQTPAAQQRPKFLPFALDYIEAMRPQWRNEKHGGQWVSTVSRYAGPVIGNLPMDEVDTDHIHQILVPIWLTKPETASRLRGRLESILAAAITKRLRPPHNPATWRGHLEHLLPSQRATEKHHEALPYKDLPEFLERLREIDGISALALEFTILNASRTGEVIRGKRSELKDGVWTIPGARMKSGREHQVPLCSRSLELLAIAESEDPESDYLFSRRGKPLSNMAMLNLVRRLKPGLTVHGFRSTFRDWVAEATEHSPEVAEMALAHGIQNKGEAAYRRGHLLERRRRLMQDWQDFATTGHWGNVLAFAQQKAA